MALEEIRDERLKKLELLKKKGIDPYPAETSRTHSVIETLSKFNTFSKSKKKIILAGRIMARREHGGSTFLDLADGGDKIQLFLKKDVLGEAYDFFSETADVGDIIEAEGILFKTKKEEKTLEVGRWKMLAKSLRPLPEKWHGLQDVEERFRKRYLDSLMNSDVRARFEIRSLIIKSLRKFLEDNGFLEVETPIIQPIPGGTLAKPFTTHHKALDTDLYLRIAPELYLKRMLVGGFERVYELGRSFRNEGMDPQHNPEFTMLECYAAYWDDEKMMGFTEDLFIHVSKSVPAAPAAENEKKEDISKEIVFKKPFVRIPFKELLQRYAQIIDYDKETQATLATRAKQLGIEVIKNEPKSKIADEIYKKICRPYLVQPTFVTNHPLEISPLAKKDLDHPGEVRRFQLVAGGLELTNAFAELNDPLDQKERFETQEKERAGGEEEAHKMDKEFLEALEYGMPPAAGLGIGVDRLVMFLTHTKSIKEVIFFPTMKPKL